MSQSKFKPLSFTTTMRNPERIKYFLNILKEFNNQILTNKLATKICGKLIKNGLYKPKHISPNLIEKIKSQKILSNKEVAQILKNNPQDHKEAKFQKGWPSRFETHFKLAKELGFVFYNVGEKIEFSEIGLKLVNDEYLEKGIFLNSFAKLQRNNPCRKVLNENIPLVLLIQVIRKLNSDDDFNGTGIYKNEIPLILYWKDNDAEALYKRIKRLRKQHGTRTSDEIILDICQNEIMEGKDIKRIDKSILVDYPDDFIRKMKLTGLFSLRGRGFSLDINSNENFKVEHILSKYADYKKFDHERDFFDHISKIDTVLVDSSKESVSSSVKENYVKLWVGYYKWDIIKKEMLLLRSRTSSHDSILKYLSNPIRLEFLTALAIKSKRPKVKVIPNYPIDDEGIPTSTAAGVGNQGDIECFEEKKGILIEVTMSCGRTQTMMEVWPISRHLESFQKNNPNSICYFIAPSIYSDSKKQIHYLKYEYNLTIKAVTIEEFLDYLEDNKLLYNV